MLGSNEAVAHPLGLLPGAIEHAVGIGGDVDLLGVATPADAALMMQLGADGVFVGSGIFKSSTPAARAKAVVEAVTHFRDPAILARVSKGLGEAMPGLEISSIPQQELLASRGW